MDRDFLHTLLDRLVQMLYFNIDTEILLGPQQKIQKIFIYTATIDLAKYMSYLESIVMITALTMVANSAALCFWRHHIAGQLQNTPSRIRLVLIVKTYNN